MLIKHFYSPITKGVYRADVHDQIPVDALEIPAHIWEMYSNAEYCGFSVVDDEVVGHAPEISVNVDLIRQIETLELSITPRRIREAVLGTDNGWLAGVEAQITTLRSQL